MRMRALVCLAFALSASGCKKNADVVAAAEEEQEKFRVTETLLPDGMTLQELDLDNDKRPDVFNTYQPRTGADRLLIRKEIDLNYDGKVDQITYFDETGEVEREEMDRDFDGQFDWTDHYQDNIRVMTEVDDNRDGRMDVFSYYEGSPPKITRKECDTNHDGLIDLWQRFDTSGAVNRTGRDTDGDGKMDVRDE